MASLTYAPSFINDFASMEKTGRDSQAKGLRARLYFLVFMIPILFLCSKNSRCARQYSTEKVKNSFIKQRTKIVCTLGLRVKEVSLGFL